MELKDHISDIRSNLKAGRFLNEAAVSSGIVQRILQALGWPVYDPQVVCPEYTVEGKRVDYALCHPKEKPVLFIEVKSVGKSEGADRQLFEYAFHKGIPMAVLTDGQEWHFYLPAERGNYEERRVYKLDILERDLGESVTRLTRYLSYKEVCSGKSLKDAQADYVAVSRVREVKDTLPLAWCKLIEKQDDLLIELIADKVEDLCGYKPEPDSVANFLKGQLKSSVEYLSRPALRQIKQKPEKVTRQSNLSASDVGFVLKGQEFKARNAKDCLIQIIEQLAGQDKTFLERFAAIPKHGSKRRYIARTAEELYPLRPEFSKHAHQLKSGWWLMTYLSNPLKVAILKMACDVAGLGFGKDLVVNSGD